MTNTEATYPVRKRFHGKAIAMAHAERLTALEGVAFMVIRDELFPGQSTPYAVVDRRWTAPEVEASPAERAEALQARIDALRPQRYAANGRPNLGVMAESGRLFHELRALAS